MQHELMVSDSPGGVKRAAYVDKTDLAECYKKHCAGDAQSKSAMSYDELYCRRSEAASFLWNCLDPCGRIEHWSEMTEALVKQALHNVACGKCKCTFSEAIVESQEFISYGLEMRRYHK